MLEGGDGHHITATLVGLGLPGEMGVSGTEAHPQALKWCFTGGVSGATKLPFLLEGWEAKENSLTIESVPKQIYLLDPELKKVSGGT